MASLPLQRDITALPDAEQLELVPQSNGVDRPTSGNKTDADYSTNWTGGVLTAPPSGQTFNAVSASFVVPQPSVPSGDGSETYSAAIWVGIDGDTYQNAIWQSGIDV